MAVPTQQDSVPCHATKTAQEHDKAFIRSPDSQSAKHLWDVQEQLLMEDPTANPQDLKDSLTIYPMPDTAAKDVLDLCRTQPHFSLTYHSGVNTDCPV